MALGGRADADAPGSRSTRRPSSAPSSACSPTTTSPGSASAPASITTSCRKRWSRRRRNETSRSSRSPTRPRSSRSPRRPSPASSTSSTRCCSAASPCSGGSSAWSSKSVAWRRSSRRSPRRSAAPWRSSAAVESASPGAAFRRELSAEAVNAIREEALAHTADGHPFVPAHPAVAGRALAHPVISPGGGPPQAWVVIVRDSGGLGDFERLILQQAVAVVALELMRRRVASETERRLAGDVLAGALGGRLEPSELRRRLEPFGIGDEAAVLVFDLDDPGRRRAGAGAGAGRRRLPGSGRAARQRPPRAALRGRRRRRPRPGRPRRRRAQSAHRQIAASSAPPPAARRRPRTCATPSTRRAAPWRRRRSTTAALPRSRPGRDLGAFTLLLSIQDDEALKLYCDSVLGPIEEGDEEYGGELLRSLEAFIEQNGQWEKAAREVYCHRHTLRYRMRRVEELTGRDLSRAHDRIEFWLAIARQGAGHVKVGDSRRDQARRVPGRDHAGRCARDGRARPRGAGRGRRRRGQRDRRRRLRGPGRPHRARRRRRLRRGRDGPEGEGAAAARGRDAAPGPAPLHLPAPRPRPRADPRPLRLRARPASPTRRSRTHAGVCRCWRR